MKLLNTIIDKISDNLSHNQLLFSIQVGLVGGAIFFVSALAARVILYAIFQR